jgi:hypothetical protein
MTLFVNACVRQGSRTKILADKLLSTMNESVEEVRVIDNSFPVVDAAFLQHRDELIAEGYYGIKDCMLVKAVGLDIIGADVEGILKEVEEEKN